VSIKANIHDAKTNLSRLIEKALAGEEVVIAKAGKPLVKLVPVEAAKPAYGAWLGAGRGKLEMPDEVAWKAMDKEIEADFYAAALEDQPLRGVAEE
jgi:prevent-host-death family protein